MSGRQAFGRQPCRPYRTQHLDDHDVDHHAQSRQQDHTRCQRRLLHDGDGLTLLRRGKQEIHRIGALSGGDELAGHHQPRFGGPVVSELNERRGAPQASCRIHRIADVRWNAGRRHSSTTDLRDRRLDGDVILIAGLAAIGGVATQPGDPLPQ